MKRGVPCDFFVLVIEGKVEITIGKEDKIFHEGPFSCFGEKMLEQEQFNFQNWSVNSANNSERYCFLCLFEAVGGVQHPSYHKSALRPSKKPQNIPKLRNFSYFNMHLKSKNIEFVFSVIFRVLEGV